MNLELLDPFRRQIPDRVDATLNMPPYFHDRHRINDHQQTNNANSTANKAQHDDDDEWKAAYHVAYNRRGTYLAVGYASGAVGVHDVLSRTVSALYRPDHVINSDPDKQGDRKGDTANADDPKSAGYDATTPAPKNKSDQTSKKEYDDEKNSVTNVSWSRRSRSLLAGAVGDTLVRLYDTTHPYGPEECIVSLIHDEANSISAAAAADQHDDHPHNPRASPSNTPATPAATTRHSLTSFADTSAPGTEFVKHPRVLRTRVVTTKSRPIKTDPESTTINNTRSHYPALYFHLPLAVGGSVEVHPRRTTGGLAVLEDGSIVLFCISPDAWYETENESAKPSVQLFSLWSDVKSRFITCAYFDPHGQKVYAASKEGEFLGFEVGSVFDALASSRSVPLPPIECQFSFRIPGGATVWQLIVSRDGKYVVMNCADGAIRLYAAKDLWTDSPPSDVEKPKQVFQDVVNKIKFAACAVSGDGEYIVGGANGHRDDKYELYIWNASTGALMDKLTGAPVQLYSVAWHPTRSFVAVATSDGLVDVWGPRINWTAFAPDFQALPMNVEYVEREDEFDLDKDGNKIGLNDEEEAAIDDENAGVDVVGVEPVPVFASDSEDEEDVFYFETKFANILGGRGRHGLLPSGRPAYEDG